MSPTPGKAELRRSLLDRRAALTRAQHATAATALRQAVMGRARHAAGRTVCAYIPQHREPGSPILLDALRIAGLRVLLPLLQDDDDLDWAEYSTRERLVAARHGLAEPSGARLGPAAIQQADLVLVPALAVDRHGHRLGRGGGSYDRALARLPVSTDVIALVFDHEVLPRLPYENHDRTVTHIATPSGGVRRAY